MNSLQKKFFAVQKKHPDDYYEITNEYKSIVVEKNKTTAITLEVYFNQGFDETVFGKTWNIDKDGNWEENNPEITFASLTQKQQTKAKEIWANL